MSVRRKKHYAKASILEPTNLSMKKYYDEENSNSSYVSESMDPSEMPENFLKLQWNSENSSAEEAVAFRTRMEDDEDEEIEEIEEEEEEGIEEDEEIEGEEGVEDEENDLYVNYSLLTDHLISGHFLSGATAEEVYVYNEESSRSTKVVTDILCDKFKCQHCNLSFLSHMFYKNHLKKCSLRRSATMDNSNNNEIPVNFNSQEIVKRKSPSQRAKRKYSKVRKSQPGHLHHIEDESSDNSLENDELSLNVDEVIKSADNLNFECDSCKCLFTSFNEMKDHVCFRNTEHQCDMCLKKCPTKAAFYEHLERSHKIKISNILSAPPSQQFPVSKCLGKMKRFKVITDDKAKNISNLLRPFYLLNNGSDPPCKS